MTPRALLLISVCLMGCASTTQDHCIVDSTVLPTKLLYSVEGAWGGGCSIECKGQALILKRIPSVSNEDTLTFQFRPSQSKWDAFWHQMTSLQLFQWRNEYAPADIGLIVDDGSRWHLQISQAGQSMSSGGDNAYPSATNVKKTSMNNDRLRLFENALEELIGYSLN